MEKEDRRRSGRAMKRDLCNMRFGRLRAIEPVSIVKGGRHRTHWLCECDCGGEAFPVRESLLNGDVQSCGCLQKETIRKIRTTHGRSKTPEYRTWTGMIDRCTNPNTPAYKNYGAGGITICDEWLSSFEAFFNSMGEKPGPDYSIDRINNDLGYEPSNCRWATAREQGRNRRGLVLTSEGVCLAEAAESSSVSYDTIRARVYRHKWPIEDAIKTPAIKGQKVAYKK